MTDLDLVGVAEIAERTGRKKQTVHTWTRMEYLNFPKPTAQLKAGPVWKWQDVKRWFDAYESSRTR